MKFKINFLNVDCDDLHVSISGSLCVDTDIVDVLHKKSRELSRFSLSRDAGSPSFFQIMNYREVISIAQFNLPSGFPANIMLLSNVS